jgi:hypothetical protein
MTLHIRHPRPYEGRPPCESAEPCSSARPDELHERRSSRSVEPCSEPRWLAASARSAKRRLRHGNASQQARWAHCCGFIESGRWTAANRRPSIHSHPPRILPSSRLTVSSSLSDAIAPLPWLYVRVVHAGDGLTSVCRIRRSGRRLVHTQSRPGWHRDGRVPRRRRCEDSCACSAASAPGRLHGYALTAHRSAVVCVRQYRAMTMSRDLVVHRARTQRRTCWETGRRTLSVRDAPVSASKPRAAEQGDRWFLAGRIAEMRWICNARLRAVSVPLVIRTRRR